MISSSLSAKKGILVTEIQEKQVKNVEKGKEGKSPVERSYPGREPNPLNYVLIEQFKIELQFD